MSERQGIVVRNSLVATGGVAVLVLLLLFYATVSGAVDRASRQRAAGSGAGRPVAQSALPPHARRLASLDKSGS